jgi:hypothetical protein
MLSPFGPMPKTDYVDSHSTANRISSTAWDAREKNVRDTGDAPVFASSRYSRSSLGLQSRHAELQVLYTRLSATPMEIPRNGWEQEDDDRPEWGRRLRPGAAALHFFAGALLVLVGQGFVSMFT